MNTSDIICQSASRALTLMKTDGSMPPGINGPYNDLETPVRTTSHWILVFSKAGELTGKSSYFDALERASGYLLSEGLRPGNAAFWCRHSRRKDPSNGLIGQAWAIEALAEASRITGYDVYAKVAEEVYLKHRFDPSLGLWHSLGVDGHSLHISSVINQHLWFAVAGVVLSKRSPRVVEIRRRVERFLERHTRYCCAYPNGLICHRMAPFTQSGSRLEQSLLFPRKWLRMHWHSYVAQSIGYHAYLLFAFSILKQVDNSLFDMFCSKAMLENALRFATGNEFSTKTSTNKYSYSYNPVGFEIATALNTFASFFRTVNQMGDLVKTFCEKQLRKHFCPQEGLMIRNTCDPNTLAARIYELIRLPAIELNL